MYQEKRYVVLDGTVIDELHPNQKLVIEGRGAVVFDWNEQELRFYNPDGERQVVKLPPNRVWAKAEACFGVLRVTGDNAWLAYLMENGEFLGEYRAIVDTRLQNGNEIWGLRDDGTKITLRTVRW